jgi:hypothetical protein
MNASFFFQMPTIILAGIIFLLIILCNWLGYRYKKWQVHKHPGQVQESMGSIEGSILGVMSLLLGFTFSVAVSKFEARRHLVVEEANEMGTAILRCDLYPDSIRNPLRADFKDYVEARIAYFNAGSDEEKISQEIKNAELISARIWKRVAYHSNNLDFRVRSQQMIPVLNNVIDIVTTRDAMRQSKVPSLILYTLLFLILIAAFLLGSDYKGHKRNFALVIGYALVMTLTLNLISELNHPRKGLINLNKVEQKIVNLRELLR